MLMGLDGLKNKIESGRLLNNKKEVTDKAKDVIVVKYHHSLFY